MQRVFVWLIYYITVKYMLLNYIDDQIVSDFFSEYRHIQAVQRLNYEEFEVLKWWIGFDVFSLLLDLLSVLFGFGHLYMDLFGEEEIFYFYNPCNSNDLIYSEGNIIRKEDGELFMHKDNVYYIKAASLLAVSTFCMVIAYYIF